MKRSAGKHPAHGIIRYEASRMQVSDRPLSIPPAMAYDLRANMVHSSTNNALSPQLLAHALSATWIVRVSVGLNGKMPQLNHILSLLQQSKASAGPKNDDPAQYDTSVRSFVRDLP